MATSLISSSEVRVKGRERGKKEKAGENQLGINSGTVPRTVCPLEQGVLDLGLEAGAKEICLVYTPSITIKFGMVKKEPSHTVGGDINWYSHYGKQYGDFVKKLKEHCHMSQQSHSWVYIHRKGEKSNAERCAPPPNIL